MGGGKLAGLWLASLQNSDEAFGLGFLVLCGGLRVKGPGIMEGLPGILIAVVPHGLSFSAADRDRTQAHTRRR